MNRIDVLDGTALGIPGLSGRVVNATIRNSGGISGTWKWKVRSRENLRPTYNDFGVTVSGQRGALSWAVEAESAPERGASAGPERVADGAGNAIETRKEDFTHDAEAASIAGSLAWNPAGGSAANLSAKFAAYQPDDKEVSKFFQAGGVPGRRLFQGSEDETNGEIGADYEFGVGPGRLKTIALVRFYLNAELRRDIPQTDWAVGVHLESYNGNPGYTLNERFHSGNHPPFSYAYVEHKDLLGMTGKFVAGNILDQHDWLRRDIHQPNRLGTVVRSVARTRQFAPRSSRSNGTVLSSARQAGGCSRPMRRTSHRS